MTAGERIKKAIEFWGSEGFSPHGLSVEHFAEVCRAHANAALEQVKQVLREHRVSEAVCHQDISELLEKLSALHEKE